MIIGDQVRHAKRDPDLFLTAARGSGSNIRHSMVVGDSVWDLLAAQRARALGWALCWRRLPVERPRASLGGVIKAGSLRASDADREETVSRLHKAATEGRIGSDELEHRVTAALKARTYADLDATVADLPRQVGPRSRREVRRRPTGSWALTVIRHHPALLLLVIPVVAVTAAIVLAATVMWAVLMVVVMMVSGRPRAPRSPWMYTRYARYRRPYGPPSRRPRSYWA